MLARLTLRPATAFAHAQVQHGRGKTPPAHLAFCARWKQDFNGCTFDFVAARIN
jgi:hypothetical protein